MSSNKYSSRGGLAAAAAASGLALINDLAIESGIIVTQLSLLMDIELVVALVVPDALHDIATQDVRHILAILDTLKEVCAISHWHGVLLAQFVSGGIQCRRIVFECEFRSPHKVSVDVDGFDTLHLGWYPV